MSLNIENFTEEFRNALADQAKTLRRGTDSMRSITADLRSGKEDERAGAIARADDPVPTAALLLRVARLQREAADAADELRRAMVAALGRLDRAREDRE
jgi:hypothetical protein